MTAVHPQATSLHQSGAPFPYLPEAMEWARRKAAATGERQRVTLRTVKGWNHGPRHRRWVVRSLTEAWDVGDRAWYREADDA